MPGNNYSLFFTSIQRDRIFAYASKLICCFLCVYFFYSLVVSFAISSFHTTRTFFFFCSLLFIQRPCVFHPPSLPSSFSCSRKSCLARKKELLLVQNVRIYSDYWKHTHTQTLLELWCVCVHVKRFSFFLGLEKEEPKEKINSCQIQSDKRFSRTLFSLNVSLSLSFSFCAYIPGVKRSWKYEK